MTEGANRGDSKRLRKESSGQNPAVPGPGDLPRRAASLRRPAAAAAGGIPEDVPVAEASSPPESPTPVSGRARRPAPMEEETVDTFPAAAEEEEAAESEAPAAPPRKRAAKPRGMGSSRRVRAVDDHHAEEGRGHRAEPFKRGLPLAVKIAAFSAVLVAAVAVGLGYFLLSIATETVDQGINHEGVGLAAEFSNFPDPIFWFPPTQFSNDTDTQRDRRWRNEKAKRLKEWEAKLKNLVTDKTNDIFLSVRITNDDAGVNDPLLAASSEEYPPAVALTPIAKVGDVVVAEGVYHSAAFKGRVRRFTRQIMIVRPPPFDKDDALGLSREQQAALNAWKPDPELVGFAHVLLKADEIDRVKDAIYHQVVVGAGAGLGIAVLLSIAMAAFLASPLRSLVTDMRAVAAGDLNHKTIPRSRDEIGQVAAQFNEMTRSLKHAQKSEQEKQAIEHELTIATEIQTKLLPDRIPQIPGYDLYSFYASAKEVGGDYYDFLVIDPTHLGIVVADVSGKGIPGSMVMTMVRSLIRLASHRETSPAETLKKVNRILAKDIRRGMFVTAIYAVLDVSRKVLTVSSAGHNPMVYFSAKTGEARQVNPPGIALGFDKGRTFDENIKEEAIELAPGDRIALYTDGVVEAMDERQEEFGMERFMEIVGRGEAANAKELTNLMVQALEEHRGKAEQSDDITITALRVE